MDTVPHNIMEIPILDPRPAMFPEEALVISDEEVEGNCAPCTPVSHGDLPDKGFSSEELQCIQETLASPDVVQADQVEQAAVKATVEQSIVEQREPAGMSPSKGSEGLACGAAPEQLDDDEDSFDVADYKDTQS